MKLITYNMYFMISKVARMYDNDTHIKIGFMVDEDKLTGEVIKAQQDHFIKSIANMYKIDKHFILPVSEQTYNERLDTSVQKEDE